MNDYRLSLDIHPGVLGWTVYGLQNTLLDMGVRVFSEGRENERNGKTGISLGAERRTARQIRKNRRRSKRRKQLTANELIRCGLLPVDKALCNRLKNEHPDCIVQAKLTDSERAQKNRAWNPLYLRYQALERRLEPLELGRLLMHLCAHRGYLSINLETISGQMLERKKNLLKIRELENQIQKNGCRTLGEYLWKKTEKNYRLDSADTNQVRETIRFKPDMIQVFPSRNMYEDEFDLIEKKQRQYFSNVRWDVLRRLLFYQRSLKMPERSFCPYYFNRLEPQKSEYRGFRAQPSAYRFKTAILLQNCVYVDYENRSQQLDCGQKNKLFTILEYQKSLSFAEAAKRLNLSAGGYFSVPNSPFQKFSGNEISCDMRKPELFGALWDCLSDPEQDEIIELLICSEAGNLAEKLRKITLTEKQRETIMRYTVKTTLAPYSALFMRQAASIMLKNQYSFEKTAAQLNVHTAAFEANSFQQLPRYGQILPEIISISPQQNYGKTWNPTVHAVFNQIRTVVNSLITRYGKPREISVYIAPEVKKTREGRDNLLRKNEFRRRDTERIRALLQKLGAQKFSRQEYIAYKLWKELPDGPAVKTGGKDIPAKHCVFCAKPITLNDIALKKAEPTFIVPFARNLDCTGKNLILAHTSCALEKGERTPFEAFAESVKAPFIWKTILEQSAFLSPQKRILFGRETPAHSLNDAGFLSQKITRYLSAVCDQNLIRVWNGSLYKQVNRTNRLHSLCSAKNTEHYTDYRRYALNAFILAHMDDSFLTNLKKKSDGIIFLREVKIPSPSVDETALTTLLRNLLVSHKPDHSPDGKLFDETALGKHQYHTPVEETDFRQEYIPLIVNSSLRLKMAVNREKFGWKKTRTLLFNRERTKVLVKKAAFVTRKKLLLCSRLDIPRIIDTRIRLDLQKLAEETSETRWHHMIENYTAKTGIRRVRIIPKGQEAVFIPSAHNKAYAPADFLFADIWRIPLKHNAIEHRGVFVSRYEAFHYRKEMKKPHPAAKFICRLYKNDTLKIRSDSSHVCYARVAGFATTQQKIDIRPLSAAAAIPLWNETLAKPLAEDFWNGKHSTQNHTAINSIFSANLQVTRVAVSPEGKTRTPA